MKKLLVWFLLVISSIGVWIIICALIKFGKVKEIPMASILIAVGLISVFYLGLIIKLIIAFGKEKKGEQNMRTGKEKTREEKVAGEPVIVTIIKVIAGIVAIGLIIWAGFLFKTHQGVAKGVAIGMILTGMAIMLAAFFLIFTQVKSGTSKLIMRFGRVRKCIMCWKDYQIDSAPGKNQWEIISNPGRQESGLKLVGLRFFDIVYWYNFRWRNVELVGGEEKIEFHEKMLDYVFLRPDVYWTELKAAETTPPERIPLYMQFLVTMRVVNPYKALFGAPSNWNENVMAKLNALFRGWVGTKTVDNILELRKKPDQIWPDFKDDPLIKKVFENEWGIHVEENGIEIRDVTLPPDYQTAAAAEKKKELETRGRAAETVGAVIQMMAVARGKEAKDIAREIDSDPAMKAEFLKLAKDLIIRKMGMESGSYLDIRVQGAEGLERALLNGISLWKRMPGTKGQQEKEDKKK